MFHRNYRAVMANERAAWASGFGLSAEKAGLQVASRKNMRKSRKSRKHHPTFMRIKLHPAERQDQERQCGRTANSHRLTVGLPERVCLGGHTRRDLTAVQGWLLIGGVGDSTSARIVCSAHYRESINTALPRVCV